MGKTTLTNNVGFNVQVKEGNSNIFRNLQVLKPGNSMTITADSNATYREYVLILLPDNKKLRPLSSDDIQDLDAIEIFQDNETGESNYDWRELRKNRTWFDSLFGRIFPKSGAKADPKADAKADANVEANAAESSKSSTATQ